MLLDSGETLRYAPNDLLSSRNTQPSYIRDGTACFDIARTVLQVSETPLSEGIQGFLEGKNSLNMSWASPGSNRRNRDSHRRHFRERKRQATSGSRAVEC